MMRWRLDLSYDGTDFHGWARQTSLRTVQGVLEDWLSKLTRTEVELTVAGRTDAGVHARGQVAHVDLDEQIDGPELARRLRRVLPPDIVLRDWSQAPEGFDARFSAIWRRYCYRLWDADSTPDPLVRGMVTPVRHHLDVEAMHQAGASLLGLRDFAPFCKKREGATTIRTLTDLRVSRAEDAAGTIECWLEADAFCHSMVRSLIGALCAVGSGQRDLDWLTHTASQLDRAGDVHVMAARGLTLEQVGYPADDALAARATEARATRSREDLPR